MKFILATNNQDKVAEMKKILKPLNIEALSADEVGADLGEVEETGETFEENAKIKALSALKITGMPSIADDSGLVVDSLNGEPGVYSARYSGKGATYSSNIDKLLFKMKDIPDKKRTAKFVCAVCCLFPNGEEIMVKGECRGKIGFDRVGIGGFGYDPVFVVDSGKTFAELNMEEKSKISHRGKALKLFVNRLNEKMVGEKNVK